ncbi:MAG: hypothetical protein Q7S16_02350 [bacterium]|nr:hypothetical protein [bacterium]
MTQQDNGNCPTCHHMLIERGTRPEVAIIYLKPDEQNPSKFSIRVVMGYVGFSNQGRGGKGRITAVKPDRLDISPSHVVAAVHLSCVDMDKIRELPFIPARRDMTISDVRKIAMQSVRRILPAAVAA